jgi:hypothetical protein
MPVTGYKIAALLRRAVNLKGKGLGAVGAIFASGNVHGKASLPVWGSTAAAACRGTCRTGKLCYYFGRYCKTKCKGSDIIITGKRKKANNEWKM